MHHIQGKPAPKEWRSAVGWKYKATDRASPAVRGKFSAVRWKFSAAGWKFTRSRVETHPHFVGKTFRSGPELAPQLDGKIPAVGWKYTASNGIVYNDFRASIAFRLFYRFGYLENYYT